MPVSRESMRKMINAILESDRAAVKELIEIISLLEPEGNIKEAMRRLRRMEEGYHDSVNRLEKVVDQLNQ